MPYLSLYSSLFYIQSAILEQTKKDGDERGKGSVAAHATLHISKRFYRSYLPGYQYRVRFMGTNNVNVSIGALSL